MAEPIAANPDACDGSVHIPGKRWPGTGIFRFGCAQRNRFLATGSCFHNRITKYAPCGLRFLGELNLDLHLSRPYPGRLWHETSDLEATQSNFWGTKTGSRC